MPSYRRPLGKKTIEHDAEELRVLMSAGGGTGGGSSGGGHTIQDEGTPLTARANLNFIGSGVSAVDNPTDNSTDVTIPTPAYYPTLVPVIADDLGNPYVPTFGISMLNTVDRSAGGALFQIPAGWSGTLTVSVLAEMGTSTSGDIYGKVGWHRGAIGGTINSEDGGIVTETIPPGSTGIFMSIFSTEIPNAAGGEIMDLLFRRYGTNQLDTYEAEIAVLGFIIDYG